MLRRTCAALRASGNGPAMPAAVCGLHARTYSRTPPSGLQDLGLEALYQLTAGLKMPACSILIIHSTPSACRHLSAREGPNPEAAPENPRHPMGRRPPVKF